MKSAIIHALLSGVLFASVSVGGVRAAAADIGTEQVITADGGAAKALDRTFALAADGMIEVGNVKGVMDGDLDGFIEASLKQGV